ncbi:TonB-dependent receptor [Sphingomonas sp. 1P06PA]|uniref:TonB-dependent receptor n=1 Tax=Sphingomonas sp. 1P06PA TaxID=554121 RepID=UPI0039A66AF7
MTIRTCLHAGAAVALVFAAQAAIAQTTSEVPSSAAPYVAAPPAPGVVPPPPGGAGSPNPGAAAPDSSGGGLEDIVVTAQKRAENLQDVPISVTAVTGESISALKAVTLQGLNGTVPNIQLNNFSNTPNSAVISIRGIGVVEPDPYAGNTVSIVYDGVPQFFSMGALVDLYDIERVEVLRGPQGTLFGANTTGGVVNIVTAQPTGEFGGKVEATYGNYDRFDIAGAIDFALVPDTLAAKIVVSHSQRDGFFTNVVDGSDMGSRKTTIYRGYLKFTPTPDFDATLIGEYDRGRNGAPVFQIGASPAETGPTPNPNDGGATTSFDAESLYLPPDVKGYPNPCPSRFQRCRSTGRLLSANNSVPDVSNLDTYRATLTMNLRNTPIGDITSITGYKHFRVFEFTDQDQGVQFLADTRRKTTGWQFSQELRTNADITDWLNLTAGAFYLKTHYTHRQDFRIAFAGPVHQRNDQDQDNYSLSGFAQLYADVTDRLRLQAGIRYTYENTEMAASTVTRLALAPGSFTFDCTECVVLGGPAPSAEKSWNNVGWKLGADYRVTEQALLYASWARGFKSGGFAGRIGIEQDIGPYEPEKVDTFELGVKTDLLDRRLRLNLGGFYTNYRDLQIAQIYFINDPVTGLPVQGNTILNAGKAEIKGFELEATALPIENLTLNGSLAYLDAKYKQFTYINPFTVSPANPTGIPEDLSGNPLQNSPKWSATAGFTFSLPIGEDKVQLRGLYSYVDSKFLSSINNSPRSRIQATNMVDANLDFISAAGWQIGVFGRNIFDKRYIQSVFDNFGYAGLVSYQNPREYGVSGRFEF